MLISVTEVHDSPSWLTSAADWITLNAGSGREAQSIPTLQIVVVWMWFTCVPTEVHVMEGWFPGVILEGAVTPLHGRAYCEVMRSLREVLGRQLCCSL